MAEEFLMKLFTPEELDRVLEPGNYVGRAAEIVENAIGIIR